MNIASSNALRECTSCQLCAAVCPTDAIKIVLNEDGFYRPVVDDKKCVDCGQCVSGCYKYDEQISITPENNLEKIPVYAASARNAEVLQDVTSGGAADILCKCLITRGGYACVGVVYDEKDDVAVDAVARTEQATGAFRGSKYIQSYTYSAFKEILNNKDNGKYAVFGTPCHIYALDKYLRKKKRRDQFLLIDIFCHGCPSLIIWKKYVSKIHEKTKNSPLDVIKFRSKVRGWGNFCISAEKDDQTVFVSRKINDAFYTLFFSNLALNDSCTECKLRSTFDYTDIRLGDFWGKSYDMNHTGVSVVVPVTDRGKAAFEQIREQLSIREHTHHDYMPYQSYGKDYRLNPQRRKRLLEIINDENAPLEDAVKYYFKTQPLMVKIKRYAKNLVLLMPSGFVSVMKRLYH